MAKFFVGQRVRVVGSTSFPQLVGTECRVRKLDASAYVVAHDNHERGLVLTDILSPRGTGKHVAFDDHQLEPILPEGQAPSEFSFSELMDDLMAKMEGA